MTTPMTNIEQEFDKFFEFDSANRSTVTSTSAKLFARHMMEQEREACCKAIDAIDVGEAPEYRACQEAIRARSNPTPAQEKT